MGDRFPVTRGVCAVVLMALAWSVGDAFGQYAVGDTVADFTLDDVNGRRRSLFDYRGQVLLLNFFNTG